MSSASPVRVFRNEEELDGLNNIPHILGPMAELAAGHTRGKTVVADTNLVINVEIRKDIVTLCHRSYKYTYAFILLQSRNIVAALHQWSVKAQRDLATVWGQMVSDRVLNDFEELFL